VGLVAGALSVGWWVYMNVLLKESQVEKDIAAMKGKDRPRIDPGVRRFEAAVDLIRDGSDRRGPRSALQAASSSSPIPPPALRPCASSARSTWTSSTRPTTRRARRTTSCSPATRSISSPEAGNDRRFHHPLNGLMSTTSSQGDHLTIIPMDFHLGVSVSKKQVMLLRKVGDKEYLFKVYQAKDIRLPPGLPARGDADGTKSAIYDGKAHPLHRPELHRGGKMVPRHQGGVISLPHAARRQSPAVEEPKAASPKIRHQTPPHSRALPPPLKPASFSPARTSKNSLRLCAEAQS
jgi:hypothetical protein